MSLDIYIHFLLVAIIIKIKVITSGIKYLIINSSCIIYNSSVILWLSDQDSNLKYSIQSAVCYHYTIRHKRLVDRTGLEPMTKELKALCSTH